MIGLDPRRRIAIDGRRRSAEARLAMLISHRAHPEVIRLARERMDALAAPGLLWRPVTASAVQAAESIVES